MSLDGVVTVSARTFLLVHTQNNDNLVTPNSYKFLNTSYTSSRQLGKKDHAIDIVVFEKLHVSTHLCYLLHVHLEYVS